MYAHVFSKGIIMITLFSFRGLHCLRYSQPMALCYSRNSDWSVTGSHSALVYPSRNSDAFCQLYNSMQSKKRGKFNLSGRSPADLSLHPLL